MAVKSPEKSGMFFQKLWVSALHEIELAFIGRIVIPKPLIASKIW